TLIRLAKVLGMEVSGLLLPDSVPDREENPVSVLELAYKLQTAKENFDYQFENVLKSSGF
ncbi:MAG: hypothetical protein LBN21_05275, partial [Treponema sp.]|nr:hypothetical protein [Treponema sp.]